MLENVLAKWMMGMVKGERKFIGVFVNFKGDDNSADSVFDKCDLSIYSFDNYAMRV